VTPTTCYMVRSVGRLTGEQNEYMSVAEMRTLRWMSGATRKDGTRNEYMCDVDIVDKTGANRFGHM